MKKKQQQARKLGLRKSSNDRGSDTPCPIVGVGASAGGLEAFTDLLQNLPADTGMAFVLIQHLDPNHTSFLSEALAKATTMNVAQATNNVRIEPNCVYVIAPNADLEVLRGKLVAVARLQDTAAPHLPVDFFFRSLARERGNRAVGVILSGNASDGTEGLRAIKEENGITFAQDPKTAKFGGMPRSATDAGVVDNCMSIPALAQELARLSRHPFLVSPSPDSESEEVYAKIFAVIRKGGGVDYGEYKSPTFDRRLARRMAVRRIESLEDYLALLQNDELEVRTLNEEILIHVTGFFRDPEVFDTLKSHVFAAILKQKKELAPIRIWVAGCSTGEEVYSLAIALHEFLGDDLREHPIQIFGSDVSEKSIVRARAGVFQDAALSDVNEERRRRFFTKLDNGYRINKLIRDLCVFVRHDLARDPPFSKIDLVSCRNVLIYFDQTLKKRVITTLHYALAQPGYLLLGRTESISGFAQLFTAVNKAHKVFLRSASQSALRFAPRTETHPIPLQQSGMGLDGRYSRGVDLPKHLDRMIAATYGPPGVLVNEKMSILQFRGQTSAYLRQAPGEPENNLFKMARGGLLAALRELMTKVKKEKRPVKKLRVQIEDGGRMHLCDIVARPFTELPEVKEKLYVVLFETCAEAGRAKGKTATPELSAERGTNRLQKLEHELHATKEYLLTVIEEHGRANDDLGATNEELVSGNEELQSLNEELETAKEELQSTNEELTTVNDELNSRNQEIGQINSDLVNLLSTVEIPIIILDRQHRIRRFTPMARSIMNVMITDIGRPFDDIKPNINAPNLDEQISEVIETLIMREEEVQDRNGHWYRMQIRPYKSIDNRIDGAILSLIDIDLLKHHVTDAERDRAAAMQSNVAKDQFLATLSHELRTPLSSMLLNAQSLSRPDMPHEKIKKTSEAIQRGIKTLVQLIDDLLDVSRIVTGKLKMELHSVDLGDVVSAAVASLRMVAEAKGLTLELTSKGPKGIVAGDAARLEQVVTNLLTNAVKFTPKGGSIWVTLECVGHYAHLSVADTGVGIGAEFLPHVFGRFSQADSSNTRSNGGLGLGLAIARHILEHHGGSIAAESPGIGQGSKFLITLPLVSTGPEQMESAEGASGDAEDSGDAEESGASGISGRSADSAALHRANDLGLRHIRVLFVDDDSETHGVVTDMLTDRGAKVVVASSADEALAILESFKPTVIISDIAMPGHDGYSFIRRVRALGRSRGGQTPALALTALASEEDRRRALSAGFQAHQSKPIDIERLADAVLKLARTNVPHQHRGHPLLMRPD